MAEVVLYVVVESVVRSLTDAIPQAIKNFPFSSSPWKYDVFLSFCGFDTRKNFTDHLYVALERNNIITFRDDEKLERGECISPALLKAIEESKYAIIILSPNYAFSSWCLIELAKIIECIKETGLIVLPVFYHVLPSHVRHQTGTLLKAFAKLEKDPNINIEDLQTWKAALKEVGSISGWHVYDRHESGVVQEILERISSSGRSSREAKEYIRKRLASKRKQLLSDILMGSYSRITPYEDDLVYGQNIEDLNKTTVGCVEIRKKKKKSKKSTTVAKKKGNSDCENRRR